MPNSAFLLFKKATKSHPFFISYTHLSDQIQLICVVECHQPIMVANSSKVDAKPSEECVLSSENDPLDFSSISFS
jgi:hypothetical protein